MRVSSIFSGLAVLATGLPAAAQGLRPGSSSGPVAWLVPGALLLGLLALGWRAGMARARAEAALRAQERLLDGILEALPLAVAGKEPHEPFRYLLWNAKAAEIHGLDRDRVLGRTDFELFPAELAEAIRAEDLDALRQGGAVAGPERTVVSPGLGSVCLRTLRTPVLDSGGRPRLLLCLGSDRTEHNRMEADLSHSREGLARAQVMEEGFRQAQKLESLGVLAGGIAHDFNNLLSALGGNLELAQMSLPPESKAAPFFLRIEKILRRASELTQQMLAYSGRSRRVVRTLSLNAIAEELPLLLEVSISKRVVLVYRLAPELPPIDADGAQIQQVIMNLVTNASEAIGERDGTITLTTGSTWLAAPQEQVESHGWTLEPGRYVTLEVSDTGCGMDDETRSRLFDPFFTTKFSGRGLGLSAMLGILRSHSAGVRILTREGEGTSFKLFFPASQASPASLPPPAELPPAEVPAGRVLVVDDEPDILEATAELLDALGFRVATARDGLEALELFQANPGDYALVLMDLTMPRMDGREALRAMRALDPGMKIVLCSGFDRADVARDELCSGMTGFLQKPYTIQTLRETMQRALTAS